MSRRGSFSFKEITRAITPIERGELRVLCPYSRQPTSVKKKRAPLFSIGFLFLFCTGRPASQRASHRTSRFNQLPGSIRRYIISPELKELFPPPEIGMVGPGGLEPPTRRL